jgi:signal peptidase I
MPLEPQRAARAEPHVRREPPPPTPTPTKSKSVVREYGEAGLVAIVLAIVIRCFVFQAFKIPSGSMIPTLAVGDHILVNKFVYGVRLPYLRTEIIPVSTPRRGDVVVFIYPQEEDKDFIKRVVAIGGDVVEVRDKRVYVNDQLADDPHAHYDPHEADRTVPTRDNFGPFTVPPGYIFVMGDNRDHSYDSRFWGPVSLDKVKGKAFLIYWSWDGGGRWVRWERIGELIY